MVKSMKNIKLFIQEFVKSNILFHSAQNAFYFVLSIFPFLYLVTKVFPFIPLPSDGIIRAIKLLVPDEALRIIYSSFKSISQTPLTSRSLPYVLIALWSSSMLIYSLKSAFATFYKERALKSKILTRLFSIALTTLILFAVLLTFISVFFINLGLNILTNHFLINYSPILLSVISLILISFDVILLYIILPPVRITILKALPGAVTSVITLTIFSYGFSYYVSHIADYSRFYGAMGSIVILLLWVYISSVIILSGGLINAKFSK